VAGAQGHGMGCGLPWLSTGTEIPWASPTWLGDLCDKCLSCCFGMDAFLPVLHRYYYGFPADEHGFKIGKFHHRWVVPHRLPTGILLKALGFPAIHVLTAPGPLQSGCPSPCMCCGVVCGAVCTFSATLMEGNRPFLPSIQFFMALLLEPASCLMRQLGMRVPSLCRHEIVDPDSVSREVSHEDQHVSVLQAFWFPQSRCAAMQWDATAEHAVSFSAVRCCQGPLARSLVLLHVASGRQGNRAGSLRRQGHGRGSDGRQKKTSLQRRGT
jgi:hypothetical protein